MADIPVKIYRSSQVRPNTSPTNPSFPADQDPVIENPSGTTVTTYKALGDTLDTSFIGKNGFTPIVVNESDLQLIPLTQVQENGLISGGIVQWTGNGYEFNISSAIYRIGGNNYASPASIKTLATPDATNDRIDVFAVDVNNEVVVITGTPATTPIKPQVNPATQLELTSVIVTAASTTPTLTDDVVYDENIEWTGTSSGTGTANFASTTSPYQGTVSIETTNIQDGFTIVLDNGSDFDLGTVQTFGFQIKLKAAMPAGQNILFSLLDASNNPIAKPITIQIDKGITTYQFSGLILSSLGLLSNLVRKVRFGFLRTGGSPTFAGYFLDIVKFEGGINPPVNISNHNSLNGLQGGNATERYHLTKDKAEAAESANAPTSSNPFATIADLGGGGRDDDAVHYDAADSKNATERNQARVNIGATSATPQVIATAGAIDDLTITSNSLVFTGASVVLSGIVAGLDGEEITILNVDATSLSILSQSTLSTANNRIIGAVLVPQFSIIRLKYRTTTNRWTLENVGINDGRYLRKDIADTKNGNLFLNNGVYDYLKFTASANPLTELFTNYPAAGNRTLKISSTGIQLNYGGSFFDIYTNQSSFSNRTILRILDSDENVMFGLLGTGNGRMFGRFEQARSNFANTSTRRDELPFNYPETVTTSGTINDLALANEGVKLLILTLADDLTGVVPVTTNTGRLLRIEGRNATGVIIRHDSASSTAANRFSIGSDLTIANGEIYTFIYTNARWRRVL
jgi:hypothetical protein